MRHHLAVLAAGTMLVGCAGSEPEARETANPYHACHAQGIPYGSEELRSCIEESIVVLCAADGHAEGTYAYQRCERKLRDMVLVTRNLEIWGYRTLDQRPFN